MDELEDLVLIRLMHDVDVPEAGNENPELVKEIAQVILATIADFILRVSLLTRILPDDAIDRASQRALILATDAVIQYQNTMHRDDPNYVKVRDE